MRHARETEAAIALGVDADLVWIGPGVVHWVDPWFGGNGRGLVWFRTLRVIPAKAGISFPFDTKVGFPLSRE